MKKIKMTSDMKQILSILNAHGKGYIVGGYIRDSLLGQKPKDCDFCTDIDYSKLKEIFKKNSPKEIGKSFGIIQIRFREKTYEIAKLRKELNFTEYRNKTEVEFISDIKEDLQRRDFTINAIAFDGKNIIYVSKIAKEDIENRTLRFVGNGMDRIKEDPLRMLRGIRIAGEKNVYILDSTKEEIKSSSKEIKRVSMERIRDEIFRMLDGINSSDSFYLLYNLGIFEQLFPNTYNSLKLKELLANFKKLERYYGKNLLIKLALIFKNNIEELKTLKLSNRDRNSILNMLEYQKEIKKNLDIKDDMYMEDKQNSEFRYKIKKLISKIGISDFENLLKLVSLDTDVSKIRIEFKNIITRKEPLSLKELAISGTDILDMNIGNKEKIKYYLDVALEEVLKNPDSNNRDILLSLIETIEGEK